MSQRVPGQHLFFADGKEWPSQRREHRQRVVGPLDRGERRPERVDLFALVKGLATDQQVGQPARFERLHVGARHVVLKVDEAPEEQADVAGLNRPRRPAGVVASGQPLSWTSQRTNSPTASGSDSPIAVA